MISHDRLKSFHFFERFTEAQLSEIAAIAEEETTSQGTTIFEANQPADSLYYLIAGYVDLYQKSVDVYYPKISRDLLVGAIHSGEIFGLSAIIEPHFYNATSRTAQPSDYIKIDGQKLRELIDNDCNLGFLIMKEITVALMERLMYTRVQLASAWVDSQKK